MRMHSIIHMILSGVLKTTCALLLAGLVAHPSYALKGSLQAPDTEFSYQIDHPAYQQGKGPRITIHDRNSPFVRDGGLMAFNNLVTGDGYQVTQHRFSLDADVLASTDVLMIANAYSAKFRSRSVLDPPSVYTDAEIKTLIDWVFAGGALLILADHSPLGGGTKKLSAAFGFTQMSGYLIKDRGSPGEDQLFINYKVETGLNTNHPITNGDTGRRKLKQFMTFGGQALIPPPEAQSILTIQKGYVSLVTLQLHRELNTATRINSEALSMGAVLKYGKGRVAIFGEAGGFTSQIFNKTNLMGFIHPQGKENPEFVLSTMRWLSGFKP